MNGYSAIVVTALCVLLGLPAASLAQGGYFGRNKVQYREFDFKVLKTDHFDIYYYPEEEQAAKMASRMAERWYTRLSQLLNHQLTGRQPLILYASGSHFRQTNTVEGEMGEGTGGVTEAYKRRIVLPFAGPIEASDHVLGHELVHAFQYDITGTNVSSGSAGALALPLWFIEGMAEYLSIGPEDPLTAMWMREATRREQLPHIDKLDNPKYFPYRYGHALWAFIAGKYGDGAVGNMLRAAAGRDSTYDTAIKSVLQIDTKQLTTDWHNAEFEAFRPIAEATKMPASFARALITKEKQKGDLNVGPELSPDGSRLIYFSEKDLFSIDLFVADARTGEVIKKITNTATNSHYESLSFLTSAGAWDAAGKRFVFPGISKGEAVLTIVDVDRGRTEREIRLNDVHEVINPAWSPDGKQIAFSGLIGGFTDLYVYDLEKDDKSALRRLTTDAYAEMDPAWSPDGKTVAFSTDRFTTNLETIKPGRPRLAIMDVATGAVKELGGFPNAKNISPQWAADGRSIYFLSDRQGITNIYRTEVDGGKTAQLTNMLTGASGVTALSPAMSFAGGRLVFSAYENDGYNIYALDTAEQLAGEPSVDLPRNAAILPPRRDAGGLVVEALQDATWGLPGTEVPVGEPYKPKWGLDFAGQPSFGVGVDPFGTYATGGISLLFSDMLGNHVIGTAAQVSSRFDEFGGTLFYLNRTHRWNWGASIDQTPYVSRGYEAGRIGNTYCRARVSLPSARSVRHGLSHVSLQPLLARRVLRRLSPYRSELRPEGTDLRPVVGPADRRGGNTAPVVPDPQPGRGEHRARLRHVHHGRDQPDSRQPLPHGVLAKRGIADLLGRAGRLAHVFDAGPALHDRAPRDVLRPRRPGRRGRHAPRALPRLPGARARLRPVLSRRPSVPMAPVVRVRHSIG